MKMNMRRWMTILVVIWLGVCAGLQPAAADELRLVNGNSLSGKVIRMEGGKLFFATDYAGEIAVDWTKVAALTTDDPIKVILSDGTEFEGATLESDDNMMTLQTKKLEGPADFNLAEVEAINPAVKPVVKITTRANLGITQERGNTDTDSIRVDAEFIARTEKSRYTLAGELSREKNRGDTTVENWLAYGNYSYFLSQKWFLYANTLFEHDKFADLDLRSTLGGGAGYQFFESPELNLYLAAGPAYVAENFIDADDKDYSAAQWLVNYDQYFFKKFVQLFHRQTGWISLYDSKNWLIKTRQGLRFPIYKGLTSTFQYNYDYVNDPSPNAEEKWDSKLMFLLGWQFQN
jgi:putative salt-induced outer membrane protein YdiY